MVTTLPRHSSPIWTAEDVDHAGVSVAVSTGSAYDLFPSRTLTHARLIHAGSTPETITLFLRDHVDVLAGVRRALEQVMAGHPDLRLIPQPFMAINQAIGTPAGRREVPCLPPSSRTLRSMASSQRR